MIKIASISVLLILLSLVGCKAKEKKTQEEGKENTVVVVDTAVAVSDTTGIDMSLVSTTPFVTIDKSQTYPASMSKVIINRAYLSEGSIALDVEYSGGCNEHSFDLIFNGVWMKSMPAKGTLYLAHNDNGDMCEALVEKTLYFNITELKNQMPHAELKFVGSDKTIKY